MMPSLSEELATITLSKNSSFMKWTKKHCQLRPKMRLTLPITTNLDIASIEELREWNRLLNRAKVSEKSTKVAKIKSSGSSRQNNNTNLAQKLENYFDMNVTRVFVLPLNSTYDPKHNLIKTNDFMVTKTVTKVIKNHIGKTVQDAGSICNETGSLAHFELPTERRSRVPTSLPSILFNQCGTSCTFNI